MNSVIVQWLVYVGVRDCISKYQEGGSKVTKSHGKGRRVVVGVSYIEFLGGGQEMGMRLVLDEDIMELEACNGKVLLREVRHCQMSWYLPGLLNTILSEIVPIMSESPGNIFFQPSIHSVKPRV